MTAKARMVMMPGMLSYQHLYHAGNRADVFKHTVLVDLLSRLVRSARPMTYIETHAGRGLYRLDAPEALKTGEAEAGITSVLRMGQVDPRLGAIIMKIRAKQGPTVYPGSPVIARNLLRSIDRMHLMELHPQEHRALSQNVKGKQVSVEFADGYESVLNLAPPQPRRGLVLVDPSYEIKSEYGFVVEWLGKLFVKWQDATVLLWYPILDSGYHVAMLDAIRARYGASMQEVQASWPGGPERAMRGCGLVLFNGPAGYRMPVVRFGEMQQEDVASDPERMD
ncbi:MAG: 23S rRNA (adenine(2030)-N(6))-methyltransferase RlmJ [Opitutales bacterium]|nr:23S rRNA (adenine(2030)-N(6))-methyltransferase RlmJ [Opitutales bacterium]